MSVKIAFGSKPTKKEKANLTAITGWTRDNPIFQFICKYSGANLDDNFFMSNDIMYSIRAFTEISDALFEPPEGFAKNAYPLAFDEGGNYFYILHRGKEVWFWDHEVIDGDCIVAKDVNDLILALQPYIPEQSISMKGVKVINLDHNFKPEFD